ncbi:MAG: hypothetical protein ACOYID_07765 [Eubacteriales bacterium]|jgi:hypothetical protein|nr:hypothetical protein [Clostridiales bacterium]
MIFSELLTSPEMSLELVLWSMFAGIIAASFMAVYNRHVPGKIVRLLYSREAHSPADSLTLEELGVAKNLLIRWSLRRGSSLLKVVHEFDPFAGNAALRAANPKSRKRNLRLLRFYIPPEVHERAEFMYIREGTSLLMALISVAVFLGVVFFCLVAIPGLIDLLTALFREIEIFFGV